MSSATAATDVPASLRIRQIVGFLVCVELASGVLQGYYTPLFTDIAHHLSIKDASVNWFEAAQLVVSALVVPVLARMGDLMGHRKVLLISTAVTAVASWAVAFAPNFTTFLIAWALQGFYVVWLPLEISIIHQRTAGTGEQTRLTRRSAAFLVAALEGGVIIGAGVSGALAGSVSITVVLLGPALAVTACLAVVWFGIADTPPRDHGSLDRGGLFWAVVTIGLVMCGLILVRADGPGSVWPWLVIAVGMAMLVPFARVEMASTDPLVDVRLMVQRAQWPVQVTAFLLGMSVLGAQIPLSTFVRTDPDVAGYGLGASAGFVSVLIVIYVLSMVVGALTMPAFARRTSMRTAMLGSALLIAIGYALFVPFHSNAVEMMVNMLLAGVGSGALVASLPAAAAAAAPPDRTGFVTGMTNTTKTIGGAIASSIFAIALSSAGSIADASAGHASLSGYMTVWIVCAATALVAALLLRLAPRDAFGSVD